MIIFTKVQKLWMLSLCPKNDFAFTSAPLHSTCIFQVAIFLNQTVLLFVVWFLCYICAVYCFGLPLEPTSL